MNPPSLFGITALLFGAIIATPGAVSAQGSTVDEPLGLHGSGTTSLAKCFWRLMSKFEEQIKVPTRFTYRAVGSGTGIREFLGKGIFTDDGTVDTFEAYNDFGAADIPISSQDRDMWFDRGVEFVQLPFVLSAVSFFHNVKGVSSSPRKDLNLTACTLARIFSGDIAFWGHPIIREVNPNLGDEDYNYPIFVSRRALGSRSTFAITYYLHTHCPTHWPIDRVGSNIEWHYSTNPCEGNGLMTTCIRENEGSIGYIDATHGHQEGLTELKLRNADGKFLTSKEAGRDGLQAAAEDVSIFPESADGDFSNVYLLSKRGLNTWPITVPSYMYIRKDLSFIASPARRALLKAFASALFDLDYIGLCEEYGFVPVPDSLSSRYLYGLDMLQVEDDGGNSHAWTFEKSTMPGIGQGERVISMKRSNYLNHHLTNDVSYLTNRVSHLESELASMNARMELMLTMMNNPTSAAEDHTDKTTSDDESTDTAVVGQGGEATGEKDGEADPDTVIVDAGTISTTGSANTMTANQTVEMIEVVDPIAAATNASFEDNDDELFLPPVLASSARCLLSTAGRHSASFLMLAWTASLI